MKMSSNISLKAQKSKSLVPMTNPDSNLHHYPETHTVYLPSFVIIVLIQLNKGNVFFNYLKEKRIAEEFLIIQCS